jgi:hypothetical protein
MYCKFTIDKENHNYNLCRCNSETFKETSRVSNNHFPTSQCSDNNHTCTRKKNARCISRLLQFLSTCWALAMQLVGFPWKPTLVFSLFSSSHSSLMIVVFGCWHRNWAHNITRELVKDIINFIFQILFFLNKTI